MTDQDAIRRLESIQLFRARIGGCFGTADGIFAGHPADEQRAKELRKVGVDNGITIAEIQEYALGYLYRKEYLPEHIKTQADRVTEFFGRS